MLAYVAACKDLQPVDGTENIILRAVRLTQEGVCLIDLFFRQHNFAGSMLARFSQSRLKLI